MTPNIPKSKKECFTQLDEMLSEKDKRAIIEKDEYELHFILGLWIRNNWLYPLTDQETTDLLKDFGEDSMFYYPDDISSIIIEAYRKRLKRKK